MEQSYFSFFSEALQKIAEELDKEGGFHSRSERDRKAVEMGVGRLKLEALSRQTRTQFGAPWARLEGFEAAQYLAMKKYGWALEYCRGLTASDLLFALAEEIYAFDLPSEAREAAIGWARRHGLWEELKVHLSIPET